MSPANPHTTRPELYWTALDVRDWLIQNRYLCTETEQWSLPISVAESHHEYLYTRSCWEVLSLAMIALQYVDETQYEQKTIQQNNPHWHPCTSSNCAPKTLLPASKKRFLSSKKASSAPIISHCSALSACFMKMVDEGEGQTFCHECWPRQLSVCDTMSWLTDGHSFPWHFLLDFSFQSFD